MLPLRGLQRHQRHLEARASAEDKQWHRREAAKWELCSRKLCFTTQHDSAQRPDRQQAAAGRSRQAAAGSSSRQQQQAAAGSSSRQQPAAASSSSQQLASALSSPQQPVAARSSPQQLAAARSSPQQPTAIIHQRAAAAASRNKRCHSATCNGVNYDVTTSRDTIIYSIYASATSFFINVATIITRKSIYSLHHDKRSTMTVSLQRGERHRQ